MSLRERCEKYVKMAQTALSIVEISVPAESFLHSAANDFMQMCRNYLSDSIHFLERGDYENSLAASSYAYAWLDAGVRLGILKAPGDYVRFTQYS